MFPTFISILDIQSWWEVPSIAHFCSLFRGSFNLLDFDIEDLEEALLSDGTEESSWLQDLIVRLLSGCLASNEISTFNYQMFLRRLFRQKCQETNRFNPFNTDIDFQFLPLRTKVQILHALCDFRLDADDVLEHLKNLEADSLRVEPLGHDENDSAYWYFYGTRLYREDFSSGNKNRKAGKTIWQVICFTEDDWHHLAKKFKTSSVKGERKLYRVLKENFLPDLPRLFHEKEVLHRKRLIEWLPRRTSTRLDIKRQQVKDPIEPEGEIENAPESDKETDKEKSRKKRKAFEKSKKRKEEPDDVKKRKVDDLDEGKKRNLDEEKDRKPEEEKKRKDTDNKKRKIDDSEVKKRLEDRKVDENDGKKRKLLDLDEKKKKIPDRKSDDFEERKKKGPDRKTDDFEEKKKKVPDRKSEDFEERKKKVPDRKSEDFEERKKKVPDRKLEDSDDGKKRKIDDKRHVDEMADRRKQRELRALNREKSKSRTESDTDSIDRANTPALASSAVGLGVGRQTNNSLASATVDQIVVIQSVSNPNRKKLKTSQVFRQSDEDLQTGMYKILEHVKNHDDAWPFVDPVEEEYAPNYYSIIRKPMDLQRMEDKLDAGEYLTFSRFKADFQLIVDNCRLYNGSDNEYTEMVDILQQVFQRATDRYLDQITSSDEEIAVEFQETSRDSKAQSSTSNSQPVTITKRKKTEPVIEKPTQKRKSTSTLQQVDKRQSRERSPSVASSKKSEVENNDKITTKIEKKTRSKTQITKNTKVTRSTNKVEVKKVVKSVVKKDKSPVTRNKSPSWPPSSSENNSNPPESESDHEIVPKVKEKRKHWKEIFKDKKNNKKNEETKIEKEVLKPKEETKKEMAPKEKNSKLRETIEKLKAKNDLTEDVFLKGNKGKDDKKVDKVDKIDKVEKAKVVVVNKEKEELPEIKKDKPVKKILGNKASKLKPINKEPIKVTTKKCEFDFEDEFSDKDSLSDKKSLKKPVKKVATVKNVADIDALAAATEQTLKDINKWLDDTPRFSEFSSASNSPSHFIGADDSDVVGVKIEQEYRKNLKLDKPMTQRSKEGQKDLFKRRLAQLKDPSKMPRRREVQRTIERLQPGKSKGNLLSNMQVNKPEELFPLGPLSKLRDSKNALVTKTDDNGPKLSLGTVLDSFGQHNFSEETEKISKELENIENLVKVAPKEEVVGETVAVVNPEVKEDVKVDEVVVKKDEIVEKTETTVVVKKEVKNASATPNLSAWFKAFGAPKVQPTQKKKSEEVESKEIESSTEAVKVVSEPKVSEEPKKVVSPEPDSPAGLGQPIRQRRGSTGSSMSERSSFSQDMDSPRMTMDERLGAYPAPYPSPLHRSPVSASPVMASPRQEEAPRAPYPALNGSIRVGFYQDTVSTKSSPDKSCSPRDQPQSPYQQYPEHVYTPPTALQQGTNYSYASNPYYTQQPPAYASTNPPPAYTERSNPPTYYDTTKPLTDQYNAKVPTTTSFQAEEIKPVENYEGTVENTDTQFRRESKSTMFPVKKRLYNEGETSTTVNNAVIREEIDSLPSESSFTNRSLEVGLMTGRQLNLGIGNQPSVQNISPGRDFVEQTRPETRELGLNKTYDMKIYNQDRNDLDVMQIPHSQGLQTMPSNMRTMNFSQGSQELNIQQNFDTLSRSDRQETSSKFDMKLGMGYINAANVDLTRPQYQTINYPKANKAEVTTAISQGNEHMNLSMRYADSRVMSHPIAYPTRSEAQNDLLMSQNRSQTMTGSNFKPSDMTIPRPPFNSSSTLGMDQSLGIRGNLANLTHIVDRFPTELSGLQNSSYYTDKSLSHMFAKSIPSSSAPTSSLPMFSQPMAYRGDLQQTASNMSFTRPELQNPQAMLPQSKSPVAQTDNKKTRKRKTKQTTPPNETSSPQGFQSYAGLKNAEPSAISLKTASVVPGSAFNFGPTGPGLGLSTWSVGDKDSYSGFLEDYRPSSYFLGRGESNTDKPVRQAHQQSTPTPAFPFLGHPQPRGPGYSIGNPFINPHQTPLMDPNSPLYQQYLHSAGVLHQGLLSPPAGYPPGYHPALTIRQPYDSMTRPSWL